MEAINTKLMKIGKIILINRHDFRDVAQSGSALHWGCSGRRFKSGHPDHIKLNTYWEYYLNDKYVLKICIYLKKMFIIGILDIMKYHNTYVRAFCRGI